MKTGYTRLIVLALLSGIFTVAATSCNTTRGFGRDVKKVGNRIENAAN
ncbi:MAG TPA: entericidin A/B family lipoprotein [Prosthecobacter sp.]